MQHPFGPLVVAMAGSGDALTYLPAWGLVLAIFYFVMWMPMQRRQKKIRDFQESLKVGDKIVTTSGIYGQITKIGDKTVQLQIADRVRIEAARAAVAGYQGQEPVVPEGGGA
jgi:preprotein translocase subunit YajC